MAASLSSVDAYSACPGRLGGLREALSPYVWMVDLVSRASARVDRLALEAALRSTKTQLEPGLTEAELDEIEARYGFAFPPDLWMMLAIALPVDPPDVEPGWGMWPNWRRGLDGLRYDVNWPNEGVLSHVGQGNFWYDKWGSRPPSRTAAESMARGELAALEPLVPVHSHRYMSSSAKGVGSPVFSVHEIDVIYIAPDLLTYFRQQFGGERSSDRLPPAPQVLIPFWSDLAERDY